MTDNLLRTLHQAYGVLAWVDRRDTVYGKQPFVSAAMASLEKEILEIVEKKESSWKPLNDVQWMNIVNHEHAFESYDKEDAVHEAVKMVELKLKENNQ